MIVKFSLLISFILFLAFIDSQISYLKIKNNGISYILRTKIHFLIIGFLLKGIIFREGLYPFFTGAIYVIIGFMGFIFGFQLREKFIKRLNSKKMIEILLKGFFSIILVFFIVYFLSQNIYIASLITIFSTSISYFFLFKKDGNAVPVYIFNLLVIFLFIFTVENLYTPIKLVFLKLLLSLLSAYLIYLSIGKREKVEIYILLIGFLLLLSGIAKELSISNLTFSFFVGFIITNLKFPSKVKLEETILKLETPLFSFLLFMVGLLITKPSVFYLIMIGIFWIAGLLVRGLLYGNFKFQIPISQISILFIVDFIGMISREFITSFIIIYLISNLLILVTGKNDYKVS